MSANGLVAPGVSLATVVGLAVMDMVEAGQSITIYVHGVPDETRETLLGKLVELGGYRADNPSNGDARAVNDVKHGLTVSLWGPRA